MRVSRTATRSMLAFCTSLIVAGYQAPAQQAQQTQQAQQAAPTKGFQPEVGQPGKDVVWVPTSQALVDKMLDMAKVTPQDYVIDLGSGDGRTVITAAKRGVRAMGIEYNPDMVELSIANAAKAGVSARTKFIKADLFETDFSQATVLTMFLLPDINLRLRPKILEMKPGTRVVSNSFTMGEWTSDESAVIEEGCTSWCTALLWIVPAKVAGKWRLANGELTLTQEFQMLSGTLTVNGGNTPISEAKMRGTQIAFNAGGTVYTGRVQGATMTGTAKTNATSVAWSATRGDK